MLMRCISPGALIAFSLTVAGTATAAAQDIPTSFYQMQVLVKTGDVVRVTDNTGREYRGPITELTGSSLALLVGGSRRDLLEADVTLIRRRRRDSLANGLLWGFGIGAGLGVAALLNGGCEGSVRFLPVCMAIS